MDQEVDITFNNSFSTKAKRSMVLTNLDPKVQYTENEKSINFCFDKISKNAFDMFMNIHLGKIYSFEVRNIFEVEILAQKFHNNQLESEIQKIKEELPISLLSIFQYLYDKSSEALENIIETFPQSIQFPEIYEIPPNEILYTMSHMDVQSDENIQHSLAKYLTHFKSMISDDVFNLLNMEILTEDETSLLFETKTEHKSPEVEAILRTDDINSSIHDCQQLLANLEIKIKSQKESLNKFLMKSKEKFLKKSQFGNESSNEIDLIDELMLRLQNIINEYEKEYKRNQDAYQSLKNNFESLQTKFTNLQKSKE